MVQQMLADSVIEINAARWMVYHAAWLLDQGHDAREHIAMVKVHAAETLGRVVDRAQVGEKMAIVPEIEGSAWITGEHTFLIDGDDPLKAGFRL